MRRFALTFMAIGVLLPVASLGTYGLSPAFRHWWYTTPVWRESVLIGLWPSSLLLMAEPEGTVPIIPIVVSVGLNAALYAVVGVLIWFGWKRSKAILITSVAALSVVWFGLLTMVH